MMIISIAVSTMVVVAIVVFAIQINALRKEQAKRDKICTSKESVGGTQEAPATT
ncbi:MAG: hypothetical protein PHY09_11425 [Desulfuromonadaceae bacterium]|nr:hypothetical protein [Desulfuromonadaceae bacterium]MDD5106735.1 hypothetical protein [Desulfuromonadaceae bacterium]